MLNRLWFVSCVFLLLVFTTKLRAERPTAPELFSDSTLVYARIDDINELILKWNQTSFGRLLADPQVSPIFSEMYGSLMESSDRFEERFDMTVTEALQIANGEVAFAVMPSDEPEIPPVVCLMIEAKGNTEQLMKFMGSMLRDTNLGEGLSKEVGSVRIVDRRPNASPNEGLAYFLDQDVLVVSNSVDYIEKSAQVWQGMLSDHKPLAKKSDFLQIMSRCTGAQGERPQLSFYIDPLSTAKEVSKRNPGSTLVFAMLPPLGIDGIKGLGGSIILAPEDFDSIMHFHLLLGSPRRVILSAIRPKEGSIEPETWVAEDVASYSTINWKTQPTIVAIKELVNTFQGPDFFENELIKNASQELKLDVQKDMLDQLDDRLSICSIFVRPLRINSQSNVYAIKLKNAALFESNTMPKLYNQAREQNKNFTELDHGTHHIYHLPNAQRENSPRIPDPAFTVLDDRFIFADSLQALQHVCDTYDSGQGLLIDSLEYKIIKQRIAAQTKGMQLSGFTMSRPEESMRTFYDMAADPKNRKRLAEMAENNPFFKALNNALSKNELPPFDVIRKHMTPSGGFLSDDDSGLHFMSFSIKRN